MEEKIGVVLVNYNGKAYNNKCIESILESTVRDNLQIVVVDNASTDDSLKELEETWKENARVKLIALPQNYGFSKANNVGIQWLLEQEIGLFLLLNNDTVIAKDAIEKMLDLQRAETAIVVPKVLYADDPGTVWCAGGTFSAVIKKPRQRGLNRPDDGRFDKNCRCGFANGCCMLLNREIVEQIGFLDEQFFLYYEDTEYSLRAAEQGIPVWYCAGAVVCHKVNGSTKGNDKPANAYYITRNWLLCGRMHLKGRFWLLCIYLFFNRAAWMLIWEIQGKPEMVKAVLRGIRDFRIRKWGQYS